MEDFLDCFVEYRPPRCLRNDSIQMRIFYHFIHFATDPFVPANPAERKHHGGNPMHERLASEHASQVLHRRRHQTS